MNRTLHRTVGPAAFLAILLLAPGFLRAEDDIAVRAEVNKAFLTIGDPVTYTVTVTHAPEIKILNRIPAPDSGILEVKKIEEIHRTEKKKIVTGRRFTLTTYRLGEFVLDPVDINYKAGEGAEQTIQTNKIYLTVKSVAEGEPKEDIRDVKTVVPLTKHTGKLLIIPAILLALLAACLIYRNRAAKGGAALATEMVLTSGEEALARLAELFDSDLLKRGFVKLYYLKLSEILRVYLEKRYGILAVESTTYEIMRAFRDIPLTTELKEKLNYVLSSADLAKFAKWVPQPAEVLSINKKAEEIVRESTPAETPEGEAPRGV